MQILHFFKTSILITILGIFLGFLWGGLPGLIIIIILSILEISLSFDNAVLNARVLNTLPLIWQKRFLTWGILIAVFGVRLVLPILIVAFATKLPLLEITQLAIHDPIAYAKHLHDAHITLSSFGGMFLFMVFLTFLFDDRRSVFWLDRVERRFSAWGRLKSIEIIFALIVLLLMQSLVPKTQSTQVLIPGIVGIILFVLIHTLTEWAAHTPGKLIKNGFMGFLYLELLDASFSFDGVMGAFAVSKDIILIVLGLTIGAIFVRSITIVLVEKRTLQQYLFLEHGAHYAIGALSILMLVNIATPVPEIITGVIGVSFIALSLFSSVRYNRQQVVKKNSKPRSRGKTT